MPGEDLAGVYAAKDFVGWYNGLPSCREVFLRLCKLPINHVDNAMSEKDQPSVFLLSFPLRNHQISVSLCYLPFS